MKAVNRMSQGRETRVPRLSLIGSHADSMIGSLVGHIRVTGVLGQGGMGDVYRGIDERLGRPVALKVIRAERRLSAEARARFLREARALSSLDHPSICRIHEYIEAEEGDYLVLELIEGVTLQRAIERGMSRARKLRVAIEICDALAAAHRKGIVHRDLKAENVMIAADGTAKILDFGIARRHEEEEPLATEAAEPPDSAQTLIFPVASVSPSTPQNPLPHVLTGRGIAVGTPAYMSPEQALGRSVGPASDMYSFGLLLQMLFTECDPQPDYLSATELMMRAASGISEPMAGHPRDLTALVDRHKRLAPADRPTAVETLDALQRIVAGPKRRARMAMLIVALVLLAGFATKYVMDVTSARREADRRRQQAEELVSFIVGDLRSKLEAVGRLDVLDAAASRALAYFASLEPEELDGDDLHKNALALAQLGEVRINEGKLDEAVKLFSESIRFASAAVARDPSREEWQLALSNAHFWAGDALRRKGDTAGPLTHFGQYLAISERLAAAHPRDAKYQQEVSYGHGNVGAAHEGAGNLELALAEYDLAADIDRRRLQQDPANEQWQTDLADSLNRIAVVQQTVGNLPAARAAFEEELGLRRRLAAAAPNDTRSTAKLAVTLGWIGTVQQTMGDLPRALASWREELGLSTKLSELDPTNLARRRSRHIAESRVASLTADTGAALALAGTAENGLRELVAVASRPAWRLDLAVATNRRAGIALRAGDPPAAREASNAALALLETLVAADPRNPQTIRFLGEALLQGARAAEQNGDLEAARRYRLRVVDLTAAQSPRDLRFAALRARALIALGRTRDASPLTTRLMAAGYRDAELAAAH